MEAGLVTSDPIFLAALQLLAQHEHNPEKFVIYCDYWLRCRINRLPGTTVPVKVLDTAVWHEFGPVRAIKTLQASLGDLGKPVRIDGQIGEETVTACRDADPQSLLIMYRARLKERLIEMIAEKPELAEFHDAWIARANA